MRLITFAQREPFCGGHMRRPHPCVSCERPTRRTMRLPGLGRGRYVLCTDCELPSAEVRLLLAVVGVNTVPQLDARLGRSQQEAEPS